MRSVGSAGGQAAAFTFDLARSIVQTRQGNPAWAGQERDGFPPIRSDDLFFPDWVNLAKVAIPQADELQRLLSNLITAITADRKPLPRFWYLPRDAPAAVVMTGDDHGTGGTAGRFDGFAAASPPGCNVAAWQCIRATSYVYPAATMSDAQAAGYVAAGFEIGLHVNTGCADVTLSSFQDFVGVQLAQLRGVFPSLPAIVTNRTHCIVFSDWSSVPRVEASNGMRLDTNYYYWPPSWIADRPGFFTGSGMPMRFADSDGSLIDVFQATTQMTDESGQSYPFTIDSLLDGATGPNGYYGVFTANMHTDAGNSVAADGADAIVASAKAHGVPVVSAAQMLTWLDGRDASSFNSIGWTGRVLTFAVGAGDGANGLRGMVPATANGGTIATLTRDGSPIAFARRQVKGVDYAFFDAAGGTYAATYAGTAPAASTAGNPLGRPAQQTAVKAGADEAKQKKADSAGVADATAKGTCTTIALRARHLPTGRWSTIVATVRRGGRPARGVRVLLTTYGARRRVAITNSSGRVHFNVRPLRRGTLHVRLHPHVRGKPPSCSSPVASITVTSKVVSKR